MLGIGAHHRAVDKDSLRSGRAVVRLLHDVGTESRGRAADEEVVAAGLDALAVERRICVRGRQAENAGVRRQGVEAVVVTAGRRVSSRSSKSRHTSTERLQVVQNLEDPSEHVRIH